MGFKDSPLIIITLLMTISFFLKQDWVFFLLLLTFILYIMIAMVSKISKTTIRTTKTVSAKTLKNLNKKNTKKMNTKIWKEAIKTIGKKAGDQAFKGNEPWGAYRIGTKTGASTKNLINKFKELFN